jgi:hypothetical protein
VTPPNRALAWAFACAALLAPLAVPGRVPEMALG